MTLFALTLTVGVFAIGLALGAGVRARARHQRERAAFETRLVALRKLLDDVQNRRSHA